MIPDPPSPTDEPSLRERCSAYLLGEMSVQQRTMLEAEFTDPAVSDALSRESELLLGLADCQSLRPVKLSQTKLAEAPPEQRQPASRRGLVLACVTLAASVLIASFVAWQPTDKTSSLTMQSKPNNTAPSFELVLAKTWAHPAMQWTSESTPTSEDEFADLVVDEVDETEDDESLGWMVAAVEVSIRQEKRNDG